MKWLNRYRAAAIGIVVAGTALMMWIGKQHLLVLDNVPYEAGGVTLAPFDTVVVKVSEGDEFEIYEDESDYIDTVGPYYTLEIEIPGEGGGENPGRSFRKKMYLGFADQVTVNLPQMVHEINEINEETLR